MQRMKRKLVFVCVVAGGLLLANAADKPPVGEHAAHAHGLGTLELVVQADKVTARFEIPMDSLLGFEYLPRTSAQKKAVNDLQAAMGQASYFIRLPAAANCKPMSLDVKSAMWEGKKSEHSDLDADMTFTCAQPSAFRQLEIPLFKPHPRLTALKVEMVSPKGQSSIILSAKDPVLRW